MSNTGRMPAGSWFVAAAAIIVAVSVVDISLPQNFAGLGHISGLNNTSDQWSSPKVQRNVTLAFQPLLFGIQINRELIKTTGLSPFSPSSSVWDASSKLFPQSRPLYVAIHLNSSFAGIDILDATTAELTLSDTGNASEHGVTLDLRRGQGVNGNVTIANNDILGIRVSWPSVREMLQRSQSSLMVVAIRVSNPFISQDVAVDIVLGYVNLSAAELKLKQTQSPHSIELHFADMLDGSLLQKFLLKVDSDPRFEGVLSHRLMWGQAVRTALGR